MATSTTTFRLTPDDRALLEAMADELICSKADVLRLGLDRLRRDPRLRDQIRTDNLARAFLKSLRTQYGDSAVIELVDGPTDSHWRLAGEPLDTTHIDAIVRPQGEHFVLDLIDKDDQITIANAVIWDDEDQVRHAVVPLTALWVHSGYAATTAPRTRMTHDGRTVVEIEEEDGPARVLVLDNEGHSRRVDAPELELPTAVNEAQLLPSVGIGVRRESLRGPHLGRGFGGKWELVGDLDADRQAVVDSLQNLIDMTRAGELDGILGVRDGAQRPTAHHF